MIYRLILAEWAVPTGLKQVVENELNDEQITDLNLKGYNVYWYPNSPSKKPKGYVQAKDIDQFNYVFVDLDLKDFQSENKDRRHEYQTKETFIDVLNSFELPPTSIIDSGNGIHAYWEINDLDAMTFLRLNRRLGRHFKTDPAITRLNQLMRAPGTFNVKTENFKECSVVGGSDVVYSSEQLDKAIMPITIEDEEYCKEHYDTAYELNKKSIKNVQENLPSKFLVMLKDNPEIKKLYSGNCTDRSGADFRLAHLLLAAGFTKDETLAVLYNTSKAIERSPKHRYNYASNIVEKLWQEIEVPGSSDLSSSVLDIIRRTPVDNMDDRIPCSDIIDATKHGFRLGEVFGLVGGSSCGKTALSMNMFKWFAERNPDMIHLFVSLEEQELDFAKRWITMVGQDSPLSSVVRVLSNNDSNGVFRDLDFDAIKNHVIDLEKSLGKKIGSVVIDHIGALKLKSSNGENQGLIEVCKKLKTFAVETKTFLTILSHTSRDKAGTDNDLELGLDAAYGTNRFEAFVDYMVTTWQPIKLCFNRMEANSKLLVNAFKFCKIRKMNVLEDRIKRDSIYLLKFEQDTETFSTLTDEEYVAFEYWDMQATNIRNRDRTKKLRKVDKISWVTQKTSS